MIVTKHSHLSLYPLKIRKDSKNFIVEDIHSGDFFEMPAVCIDAINMINEGLPLYHIEEVLQRNYPNEQVEIVSFVEDLLELGLVRSIDGEAISRRTMSDKQNGGLGWISPKVGRTFFNRYSSFLYFLIILSIILLFVFKPGLFPAYEDIFLFDLMISNLVVFLALSFFLVVVHEFGHVLAVRAEGLPTKIELGHRLFFIVLETDMSRVWSLKPEKRYRLYLAGMYFDAVVLFLGLMVQILFVEHYYVVGIAKMVVFSTFIRVIYQFCVYMKTDMYYVLENWSGCYNLMESGQKLLKQWFPFLPIGEKSSSFDGEDKFIRPYALFYLLGVLLTIVITVFYNLPLIIHAGILVLPGFIEPASSIHFWDATVFLLQFVLMFGLLAYSWSKKYLEKEKATDIGMPLK